MHGLDKRELYARWWPCVGTNELGRVRGVPAPGRGSALAGGRAQSPSKLPTFTLHSRAQGGLPSIGLPAGALPGRRAPPELHVAEVSALARAQAARCSTRYPPSVLSVRVEGQLAGGEIAYVGSIGPLQLAGGERLHEPVVLVSAYESAGVTSAMPARFLHSATRLRDGRVLVSGGFSQPVATDCPQASAQGLRCYRSLALQDAWLFDPNRLTSLRSRRPTRAHAGHTSRGIARQARDRERGARSADVRRGRTRLAGLRADGRRWCGHGTSSTFEVFEPNAGGQQPSRSARRALRRSCSVPGVLLRFSHSASCTRRQKTSPSPVRSCSQAASATTAAHAAAKSSTWHAGAATARVPWRPVSSRAERQTPSALALNGRRSQRGVDLRRQPSPLQPELAERWLGVGTDPAGEPSVAATEDGIPGAQCGSARCAPSPSMRYLQALAARLRGGARALDGGLILNLLRRLRNTGLSPRPACPRCRPGLRGAGRSQALHNSSTQPRAPRSPAPRCRPTLGAQRLAELARWCSACSSSEASVISMQAAHEPQSRASRPGGGRSPSIAQRAHNFVLASPQAPLRTRAAALARGRCPERWRSRFDSWCAGTQQAGAELKFAGKPHLGSQATAPLRPAPLTPSPRHHPSSSS